MCIGRSATESHSIIQKPDCHGECIFFYHTMGTFITYSTAAVIVQPWNDKYHYIISKVTQSF